MDTKPTHQVLLKVTHNSVVATFQDPNKPSRKPLMLSFQTQTSSQTVTPTCQLTPPFPQAIPSLFHQTNSISPDKPTSHSGSQTCSAPASPRTSWEPAPCNWPTCSAVAPCAAHLHCENAKKMGDRSCWGAAQDLPHLRCLRHCHLFLGSRSHAADAAGWPDPAPQQFHSCETRGGKGVKKSYNQEQAAPHLPMRVPACWKAYEKMQNWSPPPAM